MLRLIRIESLTQGISANLFAGHFLLYVRLNPPQDTALVRVAQRIS